MVKQIGNFRLLVGDPPHIYITIEMGKEGTWRFHSDQLIDLKRCVDDAILTSIYRLEKDGLENDADYLRQSTK